jgi:trans-aconitate 2-methyltransferase
MVINEDSQSASFALSWSGERYSKNSSFQKKAAHAILDHCLFSGSASILDLGCGDGELTAYIASQVPRGSIIGIDCAPEMISYAKETYKLPNLTFVEQFAEYITYSNRFDIVFSFFCLQWVKKQPEAFNKIALALKPGGKVHLLMSCMSNPLRQTCHSLLVETAWKEHFSGHEIKNTLPEDESKHYAKLLCNNGLTEVKTVLITPQADFTDETTLKKFLCAIPFGAHLPEPLKTEWVDQFAARLKEKYFESDGSISFNMPCMYVNAIQPA